MAVCSLLTHLKALQGIKYMYIYIISIDAQQLGQQLSAKICQQQGSLIGVSSLCTRSSNQLE